MAITHLTFATAVPLPLAVGAYELRLALLAPLALGKLVYVLVPPEAGGAGDVIRILIAFVNDQAVDTVVSFIILKSGFEMRPLA